MEFFSLSSSLSLLNSIWGHSELSFLETDLWIKLRARQREKKNLKSVTVWRNTELKELLTGPPNKDTQNIDPQLSHQEMNRFSFMSRQLNGLDRKVNFFSDCFNSHYSINFICNATINAISSNWVGNPFWCDFIRFN